MWNEVVCPFLHQHASHAFYLTKSNLPNNTPETGKITTELSLDTEPHNGLLSILFLYRFSNEASNRLDIDYSLPNLFGSLFKIHLKFVFFLLT